MSRLEALGETAADRAVGGWTFSEIAPAKINLTLRVLGREASGYHRLESLVVFADVGERLEARQSVRATVEIGGPMGHGLPADGNLVLAADTAFRRAFTDAPQMSYRLEKHIPVAAGLGGGSADAAAVLRILCQASGIDIHTPEISHIALEVGADVPVCVKSDPSFMTGIGEGVAQLGDAPALNLLLVNPGVAISTANVFAGLGLGAGENFRSAAARTPAGSAAFLQMAEEGGNDLEAPARKLAPVIDEVLEDIRRCPECRLARMSGSGATCFGLFSDEASAQAASAAIAARRPDWWVKPVRTLGT